MSTKAKWFDLPHIGEKIDTSEIATKVYKERFSEETFDQMWEMFCGSESDGDSQKSGEVEEKAQGDDVDAITTFYKNTNFHLIDVSLQDHLVVPHHLLTINATYLGHLHSSLHR